MKTLLLKVNFDKSVAIKITLYFVLAFGISYCLNLLSKLLPVYGIKWVLNVGCGPFLSALLVSFLYKTPLTLTLFSKTAWIRQIEFVGLGLFFIGTIINNILVGNTDYSLIFLWSVYALYYTLLEELGWRVFLGKELRKYSFLTVVIVSTVLWFTWHYSFPNRLTVANPFQFLGLIAAGSAGMAALYRQTKSWLLVALTHALVNVNPPSLPTLVIFLVIILGLLRLHEAKNKRSNADILQL
ncbi:CPBP family intramembrane glutamic endopeptidase [Fibrella forsythiae]|uniref:CPBP family intramembrane metalloprotease n=1 Tax=Fibrella forsythiae TaxID=2817061 RepID=A0ABS3JGQ5_9BACT|nr:CPBP family intramembrane glutamic endopeptidase [Fibrella forsythiae]MBO0949191.1 CPBP family intramembrane metalloprotease [Fibrella forsythiae]